jgi:UDP-N-acetylglucosamine:LPS N-acetylglucosamine transferase
MNVYIVSSAGGHLNETLSMIEAFENCDIYTITLDFPNMKDVSFPYMKGIYKMPLWFDYSIKLGLPITLFVSFFSILKIFLKHRPHIIFSAGSEIALPAFFLGKFLFRAKFIYMESLTRIKSLSLTGKIVYPFADLFLVQWQELAEQHEKALYRGRLI